MSDPTSKRDPFEELEVVTHDTVAAAQFHLKSVPNSGPAATNWTTFETFPLESKPASTFHLHASDEPTFKPLIVQESSHAPASIPFTPLSTANTSAGYDEFGLPITAPSATAKKTAAPDTRPVAVTAIAPAPQKTSRAHLGVPLGVDSLLKAVKAKDMQSVQDLLKQGMNPNAQNEENQTPLHLAVLAQSPEMVRLLLGCPVLDPNMVDIAFNTPLHIAACHCDAPIRCSPDLSDLVPALLPDNTPHPSDHNSLRSSTLLVPASTVNDISGANDTPLEAIIRLLCADERVDVNIRNASLHVPLIYACLSGNYKVAALIVKAGASVNAATHTDIYPLHAACENGYADIVRLLLLNGALVNVRDYQGYTPLHLAARGNFGAICGLLWKHRADLNALTTPTQSQPIGKRPCDLATDPEIKNFLSGMKTSSSHPLEVNFAVHSVLGKSRIGMTMCPGRNKKDHRRNLTMDIAALLQVGTQVLVTLVQQHELDSMKIPDMMTRVRRAGIEVIHAPIKDKWIPSRVGILVELVDLIVARVKLGKCITVHCNGGKGRTGLVVAATLVALGMEPGPATDLIRAARPGMLYNPAQIVYLRLFQRTIAGRNGAPSNASSPAVTPTELAVFEAQPIDLLDTTATKRGDLLGIDTITATTSETLPEPSGPVCLCEDEDDEDHDEQADDMASGHAPDTGPDPSPNVLAPTSALPPNIAEIQRSVNAQEREGLPQLPIGEQKPAMSVGQLLESLLDE